MAGRPSTRSCVRCRRNFTRGRCGIVGLCRVRLCYGGPVAAGCQYDGSRYPGGRRHPLRLIGDAAAPRSVHAHWSASDRLVTAGPSHARRPMPCAWTTGQGGTPLWRFRPLQRMKPGCAIRHCHASNDPTLTLAAISRSLDHPRLSGNAARPCGFSPADHAAPGSFVTPYRYPPISPSRAPDAEHRSWGCTLRSVVPVRQRRDVSITPVPRVVSQASIPAKGICWPGDQPRIAICTHMSQ
jgi:hypothetical protein